VATVFPRAPQRRARGDRRRPRAPRARRVAACGGDPGRTPAPQAERRVGRPRLGAESRARSDRGAHVIRWAAPGPYEVVFSTRVGGVSDGPYASLNLGRKTGDAVERVDENRAILCERAGADVDKLTMNRQTHSARVNRGEAGVLGGAGDGLWTDESGVPLLAVTADCVPIALACSNGDRPALCVLHA